MSRPRHTLTSAELKAKHPRRYPDGAGLGFHNRPGGGAQWYLHYTIFGRRHEKRLGSFPGVTLKSARQEAPKWQAVVREGKDAIKERERLRREAGISLHILNDVARDAVENRKADLKGDGKAGRRDKTSDFRVPISHEAQKSCRDDGWNALAEPQACCQLQSPTGRRHQISQTWQALLPTAPKTDISTLQTGVNFDLVAPLKHSWPIAILVEETKCV